MHSKADYQFPDFSMFLFILTNVQIIIFKLYVFTGIDVVLL